MPSLKLSCQLFDCLIGDFLQSIRMFYGFLLIRTHGLAEVPESILRPDGEANWKVQMCNTVRLCIRQMKDKSQHGVIIRPVV